MIQNFRLPDDAVARMIEQAREENSEYLLLSNCNVLDLTAILQITSLERLDLSDTPLTDFTGLAKLSALRI